MKIPYELKNTDFVIGQISQLYASDPVGALKEYVTNAIDAFSDASLKGRKKDARIGVIVNKEEGTIVVQDNALGMSYDFLCSIPSSIGESSRRGIKEMRGEKAFGMLAYCGFGESASVLTRTGRDNGNYSSLQMKRGEKDANADRLEARVVDRSEGFASGTRVTITGVPRKTIEDYFTPQKLKRALGETYEPIIRSDEVGIYVGWHGRNERLEKVESPEHKGEIVLADSKETPRKVIRIANGSLVSGGLEVNLWLNPEGVNDKVGLYCKGVRALESVGRLKELEDLWTSGKLSGYVNADFVSLTPDRDGLVRDAGFDCLVEMLKVYEPDLSEQIKKAVDQTVKKKADSILEQIAEKLGDVYARKPNPFTKGTGEPLKEPRKTGVPRDKPRKHNCPFALDIVDFDAGDAHKRYKLEDEDWILINSGHNDFRQLAVGRGAKDKDALQYFAAVIANAAAFSDYVDGRKALAKNSNQEYDPKAQMTAESQQAIAERSIDLKLDLLDNFGIIRKRKKKEE